MPLVGAEREEIPVPSKVIEGLEVLRFVSNHTGAGAISAPTPSG
jgi:hypothetical protein